MKRRNRQYAANTDIYVPRSLYGHDPQHRSGHHHRQPEPAEDPAVDHRTRVRPRRGAAVLFFLRAEPLQTAHHLAPHAQTHHHAARGGPRRRASRNSRGAPAAGHASLQHDPFRTALRQPHHPLHGRCFENGGPAGGDRPGETPHPYPVLHLLRRRDGLPPARCAGGKSPAGSRGAHPLRRCGVQRR